MLSDQKLVEIGLIVPPKTEGTKANQDGYPPGPWI